MKKQFCFNYMDNVLFTIFFYLNLFCEVIKLLEFNEAQYQINGEMGRKEHYISDNSSNNFKSIFTLCVP